VFLDHTATIQLTSGEVWEEQVTAAGERSFNIVAQPVTVPSVPLNGNDSGSQGAISLISFNADGTLVATRHDSTPRTVWIWDLKTLTPRSIIIQHSPIKNFNWHPTKPELLLTQCTHDEPFIYIWNSLEQGPEVIHPGYLKTGAKLEARWFSTPLDRRPYIAFGDTHGYVIVWPHGRDPILKFNHSELSDHDDETEDSLFDILTGRTPMEPTSNTDMLASAAEGDSGSIDDTFGHRNQQKQLEASMDESFF
jgi:WD40 repeat protein